MVALVTGFGALFFVPLILWLLYRLIVLYRKRSVDLSSDRFEWLDNRFELSFFEMSDRKREELIEKKESELGSPEVLKQLCDLHGVKVENSQEVDQVISFILNMLRSDDENLSRCIISEKLDLVRSLINIPSIVRSCIDDDHILDNGLEYAQRSDNDKEFYRKMYSCHLDNIKEGRELLMDYSYLEQLFIACVKKHMEEKKKRILATQKSDSILPYTTGSKKKKIFLSTPNSPQDNAYNKRDKQATKNKKDIALRRVNSR